jgi:uncharacterized membrane protein
MLILKRLRAWVISLNFKFFLKFNFSLLFYTSILQFSCTKEIGKKPKYIDTFPSYRNTVSAIFNLHCNSCHSHPGSGGIDLDTYESAVRFTRSGDVLRVIQQTDSNEIMMPPPPNKHLTQNEIDILQHWSVNNYVY